MSASGGHPLITTNASGTAIALTGYTPTGFPGQIKTLPDLWCNRHRDYDPTTGKYIQADPIGLAGDANPYGCAGANPLGRIDPEGLRSAADTGARIGKGVGGVIGAVAGGAITKSPGGAAQGGRWGAAAGAAAGAAVGSVVDWCLDENKKCPPCRTISGRTVQPGTIGYRHDLVPPSRKNYPFDGDHYVFMVASQNPNNCKCSWSKPTYADGSRGLPPPVGSIPLELFQ